MHRVTMTLDDGLMIERDQIIDRRGQQNRSEAQRPGNGNNARAVTLASTLVEGRPSRLVEAPHHHHHLSGEGAHPPRSRPRHGGQVLQGSTEMYSNVPTKSLSGTVGRPVLMLVNLDSRTHVHWTR
jgi:hypothetical protein